MVVAAYVLADDQVAPAASAWRGALAEFGIPLFHMVDFAAKKGAFRSLPADEANALNKRLVGLITEHMIFGVACAIPPHRFETFSNFTRKDIYAFCVDNCLRGLLSQLDYLGKPGPLSIRLESGHSNQSTASRLLHERVGKFSLLSAWLHEHQFCAKAEEPLLQTADILAWQVAKHVRSRAFDNRSMRKDYEALARSNLWVMHYAARPGGVLMISDTEPHIDTPTSDLQLRDFYLDGEAVSPMMRGYYEGTAREATSAPFQFSEEAII